MMDDKLKPCPFCGGEAELRKFYHRFVEWWFVSCSKCNISQIGRKNISSFEAIEAWNRRAAISPCDLCRFAPPSSMDGKPCTMCVAEGRGDDA
jgi:Lar family restriction alleviation protein